jgi:isoquinoline 1-oxidoreductase beta subunit
VPLATVRLVPAGHESIYGNVASLMGNMPFGPRDRRPGQEIGTYKFSAWVTAKVARELGVNITGGSSSVADMWEPLRLAAATARAQLLGAAALQHKLPVAELTVKDGVIHHASGKLGHYGELAQQAALTPPGEVKLKAAKDWTQIGQALPRIDLPGKVNGSARFGIDVRQPGQLFAAIRHSPMLGGGLGPANVNAVLARPGVLRVVQLGPVAGSTAAYAVVARTTWHAEQAARALDVAWATPTAGTVDTAAIDAALERQAREAHEAQGGFAFTGQGDVKQGLAGAARRLQAVYRAPYLAHVAMEPMNCTVQVKDGQVTLWVPTQVPGAARDIAAKVAGVKPEAVTVNVTYLGGGFGRRLDIDFIGQAVRVALETGGAPVQLCWSREEDMTHDFYRPAGVAVLEAGLDAAGKPLALAITAAGDSLVPRWLERMLPDMAGLIDTLNRNAFPDGRAVGAMLAKHDAPDKTAVEGLFDQPYAIDHVRVAHVPTLSGVPVGSWRSVGHSHHAFFKEGFIDELAHLAKADPVAYRLGLLEGLPRHAAVLKRAAEAAGWGQPLPAGRARGVALHESFGSIAAQVIEVEKVDGKPAVRRVVCAIDCGVVVNPAIVARQVESAVVFGLTAALFGRIDIKGSVVQQKSFPDYPLLTMAQCPVIETYFVPSDAAPTGVGEVGTPPVAPALVNAWFALTGKRRRQLPLLS